MKKPSNYAPYFSLVMVQQIHTAIDEAIVDLGALLTFTSDNFSKELIVARRKSLLDAQEKCINAWHALALANHDYNSDCVNFSIDKDGDNSNNDD